MRHRTIPRAPAGLGITALVVVVAALPAGGAGAAPGGTERPFRFHGTGAHTIGFDGIAGRCPGGTIFRTFIASSGHALHTGGFTVSGDHCTYAGLTYGNGRWTLTAANGDTFSAPYEPAPTQPPSTDPTLIVTDTVHTVSGGSGRFEGASGSFTCRVTLSNIDWATFRTDLTADCAGTISY